MKFFLRTIQKKMQWFKYTSIYVGCVLASFMPHTVLGTQTSTVIGVATEIGSKYKDDFLDAILLLEEVSYQEDQSKLDEVLPKLDEDNSLKEFGIMVSQLVYELKLESSNKITLSGLTTNNPIVLWNPLLEVWNAFLYLDYHQWQDFYSKWEDKVHKTLIQYWRNKYSVYKLMNSDGNQSIGQEKPEDSLYYMAKIMTIIYRHHNEMLESVNNKTNP